jgi:hypothetical protein
MARKAKLVGALLHGPHIRRLQNEIARMEGMIAGSGHAPLPTTTTLAADATHAERRVFLDARLSQLSGQAQALRLLEAPGVAAAPKSVAQRAMDLVTHPATRFAGSTIAAPIKHPLAVGAPLATASAWIADYPSGSRAFINSVVGTAAEWLGPDHISPAPPQLPKQSAGEILAAIEKAREAGKLFPDGYRIEDLATRQDHTRTKDGHLPSERRYLGGYQSDFYKTIAEVAKGSSRFIPIQRSKIFREATSSQGHTSEMALVRGPDGIMHAIINAHKLPIQDGYVQLSHMKIGTEQLLPIKAPSSDKSFVVELPPGVQDGATLRLFSRDKTGGPLPFVNFSLPSTANMQKYFDHEKSLLDGLPAKQAGLDPAKLAPSIAG